MDINITAKDFSSHEIWKEVKEYEGLYEVSNLGRVRSLDKIISDRKGRNYFRKGQIIKPQKDSGGYNKIKLSNTNNIRQMSIHRLVAEAFIPNPDNLPCVNHKNEVKTDNRVENLEWCTPKYNTNYGTCIERGHKKLSKSVLQYTLDGTLIAEYPSIRGIEKEKGFYNTNISACCRGKIKTAHGYIWRYKNEVTN